jgi:ABC-type spermidine/putrescine transport system permease subunit II
MSAITAARRRRFRRGVERKPVFAFVCTGLFFFLLYLPIGAVVLFSFNGQKSLVVMKGWSLQWYRAFFESAPMLASLRMSIEISAISTVATIVIGVAFSLGLVRSRGKVGSYAALIMLIPLITPEIVTGVGALTLFKGIGLSLGFGTVTLAEVTFSISYVTIILRSRIAALNPETEEAAMDLGATRWQALRLVTLPALIPAILAAGVLVFAMIFDDFVLAFFTTGVSPQPIAVNIYSQIRLGVQPSINAVGTVMLVGSLLLVGLAVLVPRLFGVGGGLKLLTEE